MESEEVDLNEELQHLDVDVEALEADLKEVWFKNNQTQSEKKKLKNKDSKRMILKERLKERLREKERDCTDAEKHLWLFPPIFASTKKKQDLIHGYRSRVRLGRSCNESLQASK